MIIRSVDAYAKAAMNFLGTRGIAYLLIDKTGTTPNELAQIDTNENLKVFLRQRIKEARKVTMSDLRSYLGYFPEDDIMDQIQSLVLRYNLNYQTDFYPSKESKTGYNFDFKLSLN